jgi:hypothetical protein
MQGKYSDGKTMDAVAPTGGAASGELYRINGWNGICEVATDATKTFALNIDTTSLFWVKIPVAVVAGVGDVLYMPPATNGVGSTALTATATANVAALKVVVAKDANNYVGARLLNVA